MPGTATQPMPLPRSLVLLRDWERGYANLVALVGGHRMLKRVDAFPWLGALLIYLNDEEQDKLVARGGFDGVCESYGLTT